LGCVMMRACHLNTCPVGVATQDPRLRERFSGKPEHVENFMRFIAREVREMMAQLGFKTFGEMVGKADVLEQSRGNNNVDLSRLIAHEDTSVFAAETSDAGRTQAVNEGPDLLEICKAAIDEGLPVEAELSIRNTDRAVGTKLGAAISRKYGAAGLPT